MYIPFRNPSNLAFLSQPKALAILLSQSPHKNIIDQAPEEFSLNS
jgi:hypothetical protein